MGYVQRWLDRLIDNDDDDDDKELKQKSCIHEKLKILIFKMWKNFFLRYLNKYCLVCLSVVYLKVENFYLYYTFFMIK